MLSGRLERPRLGRLALAIALTLATIAAGLTAFAAPAGAQPDNFLNGDGHDGGVTFAAGTHIPNALAPVSGAVSAGATTLTTGAVTAGSGTSPVTFANNRLVMILQTTGWTGTATSGSQSAVSMTGSQVGKWEFARISSYSAPNITFTAPLINSYANGSTQVIAVPEYTTMTVNAAGANITGRAWNGTIGGVVVILANNTINFSAAGTVHANSLGFRGAVQYEQNPGNVTDCDIAIMDGNTAGGDPSGMKGEGIYPTGFKATSPATALSQEGRGNYLNGGGGGTCFNASGGGGSNAGAGGIGGNTLVGHANGNRVGGGLGGAPLTYNAVDRAVFGGGGGAGDANDTNTARGGTGGGFVMVRGASLTGTGNIRANGGNGLNGNNVTSTYPDGAGGGAAGGVVIVRMTGATTCSGVSANGGTGGNAINAVGRNWTPGGGGGGGRTYIQGSSISCAGTAALGAAGTNGGNTYGAASGTAGSTTSNATGMSTPTVALSTPADGAYVSTATPSITGTATASSTVYIYIDDAYAGTTTADGSGNWSYTTGALTQAAHTVKAYSEVAGSASAFTASRTFTVDTTAPTVSISAPANGSYTTDSTPSMTFSVTETNQNATECRVDGGSWASCTSGTSMAALTDGSHTLDVRHTDDAGNVGSASTTFTVDTTNPSVSISAPANGSYTTDSTPLMTFGVTETNQNTTECRVDGGSWASCTSGTSMAALTDGSHTLDVRHTDDAGNVGSSSTTFTVDTTAPSVSISAPANGSYTTDNTPLMTFSVTETNQNVTECRVDGGSWAACTSGTSMASLADGSHNLDVRHTDDAGLVGSSSTTFTVDTTNPSVSISAPANGSYTTDNTPLMTFSVTETNQNVTECRVDGGSWAGCTSGTSMASLTDGSHTLDVRHTDDAGNVGSSSTTFTVDTTSPSVSISAPANGSFTGDNTPLITFSITETNQNLTECRVDGGSWAACTSGTSMAALTDGSHTLDVRHTDDAGNVGSSSTTFTVDTAAPAAPVITSPADGSSTSDTTPDVTGTAEANSTVTVLVDGSPVGTTTADGAGAWTFTITPALAEGTYSITATAEDVAGNDSAASAAVGLTIDTTAPGAPTIISPADNSFTSDTTPNVTGTAEINSTVTVYVDGSPVGTTTADGAGDWTFTITPALAEGPYAITATAEDAAGNDSPASTAVDLTVDATAPSVSISVPANGSSTADNTPAITFSVTETNPDLTECRVDGGSWATCTSGDSLALLTEGSHTLDVRHTDDAGNVGSAGSTFTVDTTAPSSPVITSPTSGSSTSDTTPDVTGTAEANSIVTVYVDGSPVGTTTADGSGNWTFTITPALAEGTYAISATAEDAQGNESAPSGDVFLTIDTTAPAAPVITGPADGSSTSDTTPDVTGTAEADSTVTVYVDGSPVGTTTADGSGNWTFTITPALAEGTYAITATAEDDAGNDSPASAAVDLTIDTTDPTTTIDSAPPAADVDTTPTFTFSSNETATFECRIDAGAWGSCTTPHTTGALTEGPHTFEVRAIDAAGNTDATPASHSWTIDTTAPETTIDVAPPANSASDGASFEFSANEASSFECRLDAGTWGPCTSPDALVGLSDGSHTYEVRATDAAGNTDATPASHTWNVDTVLPAAPAITAPADGSFTTDTTPTITGTAEANSTVTVYDGITVIGTTTADGSGDWSFTPGSPLAEGAHYFAATATDAAGNEGGSSNQVELTIDSIDPTTSLDSTPPADDNDSTPTFTFSSNEPAATFECRVDGGSWAACTSPHTTATLADGPHTFEVRAIDEAGNVDPTPASYAWNIDTAAPTTTIDSAPPVTDNDPDPDFSFSSNEPGATFECNLDGGGWAACTSPHALAGLADGPHTFEVRATDAAGNTDATPASHSWTIDTTAPDTVIDSGPSIVDNDPTPDFFFSSSEPGSTFECSVNGGAWAACSPPHTLAALPDGNHTFEVRAIDVDSNVDPTPASYNWNLDATVPAAPVIATPADESFTDDTTPTLTGTAEPDSTVMIYDGVTAIGSASADPLGDWSFTPAAPLAEGPHSFTATATDIASNTSGPSNQVDVTIDTIAPAAPVISSPADGTHTSDTTPTISGTAEANSTVTIYDGVTPIGTTTADGAGAWSFTPAAPLSEGAHYFAATATDAASNEGPSSNQVEVTIDTTNPTTSLDSTPPADDNDPTPDFTFSSNEPGSTFECRVDGGAWAVCTSPHTTAPLADGPHTFEVRAIDQAGNVDPSPESYTWDIDTVAPTTAIDSAPPADDNDAAPTFTFSANEPGSTFECSLDGGAWGSCSSPHTTAPLADGPHTFAVRATDAAGNTDATPASHAWNIDTVDPAGPVIVTPVDGSVTADTTPTLTGTAEPSSTVTVYDGVTALGTTTADGSGDWTFTPVAPLVEGPHSFTATATDAAGNVSVASNQVDLTIDSIAPAAPVIVTPADGTHTSDTTPTISGTAEANSTVTVYDGVIALGSTTADGAGAWSFTPGSPLSEGAHYFAATATDAASNEGPSSNQVEVTIDTTNPTTSLDSTPPADDSDPTSDFTFSSNEPGATFECRVDGGAWAVCTSPHSTAPLADGPHTFEVRAIDEAGNVDPTPASHSWTIDTTAPQTTIDVAPPAQSQVDDPSFEFSSNEPGSTFECSLDGGAWGACTSPHGLLALADGPHTFEVRAIDQAGNVDPTPASHTWTVDTTDPAAPVITSPADGTYTNDTTPTVSGTAEANSTVSVYDDVTLLGTATADGAGNWSFTPVAPLAAGSHYFAATATDAAGNEGASSNQVEVTIDTTAPATTIDSAPPADDEDTTPTFTFSSDEPGSTFECRVDGGTWGACTSPHTLGALTDGPHIFEVRATDLAGNTDATPASHTWNVDTTAPAAPVITSPADGIHTADDTPTVSGTAEANAGIVIRIGLAVVGATTADGSGNWSFTPGAPLADGAHAFSVTATDAAGNESAQSNVVTINVDTTVPTTALTDSPPAIDASNDPSFSFDSNEGAATFECSLDGGAWGACTSPRSYTDLADGPHTFDVRAVDQAGNTDATPASHSWTIDTTAPAAPVISSPADESVTSDSTPAISGTAEAGSTVTVRDGLTVIGTTTADGSGNWSLTPSSALSDGAHSFSATATDAAGNESAQSNVVDVTIDTTAPSTALTGTPPADDPSNDPTFTFNSDDPGATFECRLDGGAWTVCTSPQPYTDLPDGPHTFEVRAIDGAGNVDPTPQSHSWTIDTAAPAAPVITSPADNSSGTDTTPTVTGTAEPGATVEVYDGSTLVGTTTADGSGNWSVTLSPALSLGAHFLTARATDAAGNTGSGSSSVHHTVTSVPDPPTPTPPPTPIPDPPPEGCPVDEGEAGKAPKITVTGASLSRKTLLKFNVTSDMFVIARVTVRQNGKKIGSQARAINAGKRQIVIKIRKIKAKNANYTARLSAVSLSGGKAVADAQVVSDAKGKWSVGPLAGNGTTTGEIPASTDCGMEKDAPRMKVVLKPVTKVKVGLKKMTIIVQSNQFAVSTFKLIQNGTVISRKVFVLKPGKPLKKPIKLLGKRKLLKGKVTLQASTFSVDGVRVKTTKIVKVK